MGLILRSAPKVKSGDRFVQGLTDPLKKSSDGCLKTKKVM